MRKTLNKFADNAIYIIVFAFFVQVLFVNVSMAGEQQFSYLARSFLEGKLFLTERPETWLDAGFYDGRFYWLLGPFPSIVLLPFTVIFAHSNQIFLQGYVQPFVTLLVFLLCFKLARFKKYNQIDGVYLAFAFCFASVYQISAFIPWSWYFSHAITTVLLIFGLYEYFTKKRYWIIGLMFGLAFATRFTAGLGVVFFVLEILTDRTLSLMAIRNKLLSLLIPIAIVGALLLVYNYLRFDNFFDNGYMLANNITMSEEDRFELLNYGLFDVRNVPSNIYYYFIKTLDPVLVEQESWNGNTYVLRPPYVAVGYPGTSWIIGAPVFIFIFRAKLKNKIVRHSWAAIITILSVLLLYYWPGYRQVGPRYLTDLLPFAYLVLLYSFRDRRLSVFTKSLIIFSAFFNLYLLSTVMPGFRF